MQVQTDPSTIASLLKSAPVMPATPLPAPSVADVATTENRGQDQRRNPSGSPSRFRSVLDAATVAGLGQATTSSTDATDSGVSSTGITQPATEVTRAGTPSRDINGQDSETLYRAVRAYASQQPAAA